VRRPPPRKRAGQATGRRRLDGAEVLDIPASCGITGDTEKGTRSKIARGLLPHRRLGGRIILLRSELIEYLRRLPGVTLDEALHNAAARMGESA
jgi:hypothetical protein